MNINFNTITSVLPDKIINNEIENTDDSELKILLKSTDLFTNIEVIDEVLNFGIQKTSNVIPNRNISNIIYRSDFIKLFIDKNKTKILTAEIPLPSTMRHQPIFTIDNIFLYKLFCAVYENNERYIEYYLKIFSDRCLKYYINTELPVLNKLWDFMIMILLDDIDIKSYIDNMELYLTSVEIDTYEIDLKLTIEKPLLYNVYKYKKIYENKK